jgi:hypothetical protein
MSDHNVIPESSSRKEQNKDISSISCKPPFDLPDKELLKEHLTEIRLSPNKSIEKLIENCKIDLSENLTPPPVAMEIKCEGEKIRLFTKGNFSIITGAAKSRKTFFISMIMAATVKGSFQELLFCPSKGVNLIFDTEQSRYKVQQVAKRICNLSENSLPDNLAIYSLRTLEPSQRLELIEEVLKITPNINFVAIDGIIDLDIDPILQADQAQKIVSKLMKWTENYNIHITCVIHFNKNERTTLLGHLGSFAHRKADAIISVTKSKENGDISIVEPVDCREKEFLPFAFIVGESGIPKILDDYTFEKKTKEPKVNISPKSKSVLAKDLERTKHLEILSKAFKIQKEQIYNELVRNIKHAVEISLNSSIGDNKAKDFLTYYNLNEYIVKIPVSTNKSIYTLAGQAEIILN